MADTRKRGWESSDEDDEAHKRARHLETTCETTQADIDRVIDKWEAKKVYLRRTGNSRACYVRDIHNPALIDEARKFIRAHTTKVGASSRYRIRSYGGKHTCERGTGTYITNGEFIVACALEGYHLSFIEYGCKQTNARIGAKWLESLPEPKKVNLWPGTDYGKPHPRLCTFTRT